MESSIGSAGHDRSTMATEGSSQHFGAMLCDDPSSPPPRVAICLAGHARTFTHRLVHRSFKDNVVDSLGAPSVLFAYLKHSDRSGHAFHRSLVRNNVAHVRQALRTVGLDEQREDDAVRVRLIRGSRHLPYARCHSYDGGMRQRHAADRLGKLSNRFNTTSYLQSLLGQLDNRNTCVTMVARYESRARREFDWVLYARPDLLWYRPIRPYCFHNLSATVSHHDWAFMMPRRQLESVLQKPYLDYYGCRADLVPGMFIERWDVQRWRAHGLSGIGRPARGQNRRSNRTVPPPPPIQQNWAGIPAMLMRPSRSDRDLFCNHLNVAEQREWEPHRNELCMRFMHNNSYNRVLSLDNRSGGKRG